jgi:tetratricopeptide (TPR) repeat protein
MIGAGRMLWITDPGAGDRLVVVPTRGAGMGLALPYGFPQFRSLQTQQGVALQPLTPGIEVAVIRSGVLVRDRDGLLVSNAQERRNASRLEDPELGQPGLLDLPAWRRGGVEDFQDNRQALQNALLGLEGERLGVARLDLARFFFANGFGSETLGVVRVIEDENPRLALDPEVPLLKGASQVMMQDYSGAAASLAHPALAGEREALLWQAALAAQAEDWQAAATGFAATRDLIDDYARNLRLDLHIAAAEAFLQAGDLEAATIQVGALLREDLDEREMARIKVVQGALNLAGGDPEAARKLWVEVRDGTHRPSQARARLALIELGMAEGNLSPDAAIAELERLRFAWRGDFFEFTLLRKLAELYVEQDRHRDALYALREAASNFPDGPAASNAAQRMREIFAEVYRGAGDPDVPPLRALALYQEFMELTPGGPEGDRMIAGLADRLVEVDLLDRAAELLEGQVRYRLEGAEKARIGARLALIQLLNRKPEASLAALEFSAAPEAGEEVALQRRQLRARALSELERSDEALKLLDGDESLEAEHLRADIHWHQRNWPQAVTSLSKLIPLLPPRRPLQEEESQLVVNLAVALMLSDQLVDLEDLNRRYGAAMARGPHAETFNLLVGDGEEQTVSSIADELSKVAEAQSFMSNYRESLRDSGLDPSN